MTPNSQARPNYPLIDMLRAAAALMVVVYHVIVIGQWTIASQATFIRLMHIGWIGVDCFFVISGFVIALSALKDYERQPLDFRRGFALRRLARIAPLYILTMLLFVFLVKPELLTALPKDQWLQGVTHLLFIHNLFIPTAGAINSPNWSIGLEMQFYVFMLFATPWLARVSITRMFLTLLAVGWGYRYLVTFIYVPGGDEGFKQFFYTTQLPGTLDEFGMGMALAMAVTRGRGRLSAWLTPQWRHCAAWALLAVVLSVVAWQTYWPRSSYWNVTPMIVFWRTLLAGAFVSWMAVAMTLPVAHWRVFKPFCYLGQISYGIYLWHLLVLLTLFDVPGLRGAHLFNRVLLGTLVLASLSWHWLEKPFMQRVKSPPRPVAPVPPVPLVG
ncbi:MAG: acyltransferase 3 [Rhodoferax sp.]|nr:acyltransferase 3 [Rhodoferax sp.]